MNYMSLADFRTKLPVKHLSLRVPWHDNGWNGTFCKDPLNNASCLLLPRIQEGKNTTFEVQHSCCSFNDIKSKDFPPCVAEKVSFLADHEITRVVNHPYHSSNNDLYQHYADTPLRLPPYSFAAVPFRWMMKSPQNHESKIAKVYNLNYDPSLEPDLGFPTIWVQQYYNQKTLLDTFFNAIGEKKSLVFVYAKHTPFSDVSERVLIGVGRVKKVGSIQEYKYNINNPPYRSFIWERTIYHSIRPNMEDGFILPYQQILEKANTNDSIDLNEILAFTPNMDEFSYGTERIT